VPLAPHHDVGLQIMFFSNYSGEALTFPSKILNKIPCHLSGVGSIELHAKIKAANFTLQAKKVCHAALLSCQEEKAHDFIITASQKRQ
jgi:hypothetical protein